MLDAIWAVFGSLLESVQKPTLGFLIGGMLVAAAGSRLTIPEQVYKFIVFVLLMKIGLRGGIEIRGADLTQLLLPALFAVVVGVLIVVVGRAVLMRLPGLRAADAAATAGLFGAVSASTFAAAMLHLDDAGVAYEAWTSALYPFMDIPALVLAIVLGRMSVAKEKHSSKLPSASSAQVPVPDDTAPATESARKKASQRRVDVKEIILDSLQGSALSALLLGLFLGLFTKPEPVYESFYEPVFRGFLSILMLIMGMEAWQRLSELRRVAHWYAVYAVVGPITHGFLGFGLGAASHYLTGFSPGGVVLLSILAASSSDVSGPPALRAGIPSANPSAFIGASTSVGTPICIVVCIPLFTALAQALLQ